MKELITLYSKNPYWMSEKPKCHVSEKLGE